LGVEGIGSERVDAWMGGCVNGRMGECVDAWMRGRLMSVYRGEDMIGDDGYGTWDTDRLDEEYRRTRKALKTIKSKVSDRYHSGKGLSKEFVQEIMNEDGAFGVGAGGTR
jgi:hypothetical protein